MFLKPYQIAIVIAKKCDKSRFKFAQFTIAPSFKLPYYARNPILCVFTRRQVWNLQLC